MEISGRKYEGHTYIMGILNITPDSFSDGGSYRSVDAALRRAMEMAAEGADIIDVGGESTRPGYTQITYEEEAERVVPVIERIRRELDIPISIDTYKSAVAEAALEAGASLVNDIWGFRHDNRMASVVKKHDASCCLMHNRANTDYCSLVEDVIDELRGSIHIALDAGIDKSRIMTDPGIGFGKTYEQNLAMTKHMGRLHELGYPFLLGVSRKSMIGNALDLPVDQREEGTLAATVLAVMNKALFVRVHNVKANKRAVMMTEAILNSGG